MRTARASQASAQHEGRQIGQDDSPPPANRDRRDSRTHLLDVAEQLFLAEGIRATGVDTITANAGTAKTTLYRHFPTKDDLVAAYLTRRDATHFAWLQTATAACPENPAAQLHAIVDLIAAAVTTPGFRGCPFLNAAAEFGDPHHPTRQQAAEHKRKVIDHLAHLAQVAGASYPHDLARSLALLTDGAYEAGRVLGAAGPTPAYAATAHRLLDQALP